MNLVNLDICLVQVEILHLVNYKGKRRKDKKNGESDGELDKSCRDQCQE